MVTPTHLVTRQSGYFFRLTVPSPLRPLVGKREITRALRTGSRQAALRKADQLTAALEEFFDDLLESIAVSDARLDRRAIQKLVDEY